MSIRRSISDDDLCSECQRCIYRPGEWSECNAGWPEERADTDEYVTTCHYFVPIKRPGDNVPSTC